MASDFISLNANDTKELRKEIGLPVTKDLIYWERQEYDKWKQCDVIDYEIVDTYMPSGVKSIRVTLTDGRKIRILSEYLSDMQKPSFLSEVGCGEEKKEDTPGKAGNRVEKSADSYIVVDLETTGTNHYSDEITEIGAIKYVAGKEDGRFNVLVKTSVKIPEKIERLTGITNDMLQKDGVDPKVACEELKSFLGDSLIVGHNFASFDSKFLEDAYKKYLNCCFPNDYVDTLYLARKKHTELDHHSLECLSKEYDIDYSKAHRAIEDCVINHLIYEYLTFGFLLCDETAGDYLLDKTEAIGSETLDVDEQLVEVNSLEGWQTKVSEMFPILCKEYGLMEQTFSIMANVGKDNKITSYSVCAYEPDLVDDRRDSSRNTVLARIKEDVLKTNPDILEVYSKSFGIDENKRRYDKNSNELVECLIGCIRYGIEHYEPKAGSFACCSRYEECSKEKKCIHKNKLYAMACQYRKNLEAGNIFY